MAIQCKVPHFREKSGKQNKMGSIWLHIAAVRKRTEWPDMLFGCDGFFFSKFNWEKPASTHRNEKMAKHCMCQEMFLLFVYWKKKKRHLSTDTRAVSHTGRSLEAAIARSCPRAGQALKQAQVARDKVWPASAASIETAKLPVVEVFNPRVSKRIICIICSQLWAETGRNAGLKTIWGGQPGLKGRAVEEKRQWQLNPLPAWLLASRNYSLLSKQLWGLMWRWGHGLCCQSQQALHHPTPRCTYLDVTIRCPAVFDDWASSLLQGFLIWLQTLQKERSFVQGQRQESSQKPQGKAATPQLSLPANPVISPHSWHPETHAQNKRTFAVLRLLLPFWLHPLLCCHPTHWSIPSAGRDGSQHYSAKHPAPKAASPQAQPSGSLPAPLRGTRIL